MILNDRIRNMNDSEKMKYLLSKLTEDMPRTKRDELLQQISKLSKGTEPSEFLTKFNLKGTYDDGKTGSSVSAPSIFIELDEGKSITIEISDLERHWFIQPQPVKPEPPRSFLPQDELDELNHG